MQQLLLGSPLRHHDASGGESLEATQVLGATASSRKGISRPSSPSGGAEDKPSKLEAFARGLHAAEGPPPAADRLPSPRAEAEGPSRLMAVAREEVNLMPAAGEAEVGGLLHHNTFRDVYLRHFAGLQAYGPSGMTVLEELVDAAFRACETARHLCPDMADAVGAALLTDGGKTFTGCGLESTTNPLLNVTAERAAVLKAVSEGEAAHPCAPLLLAVL
jgi:hypothetical protein